MISEAKDTELFISNGPFCSYIFKLKQNKNNHYVLALQEILIYQAHQKAQKI
jgi:uncharacterized membrane protein YkgB